MSRIDPHSLQSKPTLTDSFLRRIADGLIHLPLPEIEATPEERPDPVRWIEENFYLYDTARLITLHERQRWPLQLALSRDRHNRLRFSLVVWSWPKKSAKSSIIAAVALYVLCNKRRASVKLVANDLKQADSRVGYYLREAIKLHPALREQFKITSSGYRIENLANGAICEMLPIDPAGEAGGNDDLIVLSELWAWKSTAQQKMYTEMALSPNKFFESQIWADTYAGAEGESPVLEQMYDTGVKQGMIARQGWEVYVHPEARQLTVWVTQHYLPWQVDAAGKAYLKAEEKRLVPAEFERLHGNRWVTGRNKFLPNIWWDACKVTPLPVLDNYREVVVGIDAAVSSDCFAIVAVSREGRKIVIRYFKRWIPPRGGVILYGNPTNKYDMEYPEGVLRWLAANYNVICFPYDRTQLHSLCSGLSADNVGYFKVFDQGTERLIADKELYDMIRDRNIVHDGDPALTEHIYNADAETFGVGDNKLRIVKRREDLKIDGAVALSMATHVGMEMLSD